MKILGYLVFKIVIKSFVSLIRPPVELFLLGFFTIHYALFIWAILKSKMLAWQTTQIDKANVPVLSIYTLLY